MEAAKCHKNGSMEHPSYGRYEGGNKGSRRDDSDEKTKKRVREGGKTKFVRFFGAK